MKIKAFVLSFTLSFDFRCVWYELWAAAVTFLAFILLFYCVHELYPLSAFIRLFTHVFDVVINKLQYFEFGCTYQKF